ncbi:MAG: BsuBI/PstI family type II restriction endonuclease [Candidatus Rokuibacteriota bacterium]
MNLPPYVGRADIHARLPIIFPEGTPHRAYCVREAAASAVFTLLYVGAIEGADVWLAPKQVVRMTNAQASKRDALARESYATRSLKPGFRPAGKPWYSENSREQIRDETIRQGLIGNNAVTERRGLSTTSAKPRYALRAEFAALFSPTLSEASLEKAAADWRSRHLSAGALAHTQLLRRGAASTDERLLVTFPNRETRLMSHGPSSELTKSVVEVFAPRFMKQPVVLWVSESKEKVVARDDQLAAALRLQIAPDRNLPDIILVDLEDGRTDGNVLIAFIEVVVTDGAITTQRQSALLKLATDAGFPANRIAFVTAFRDRSDSAFKKTITEVAWNSFVWFAAEPQHLLAFHDGGLWPTSLSSVAAKLRS